MTLGQPPDGSPATGQPQTDSPGDGLFETAVSVITEPVSTLRRVTERRPVGWAVAIVLVLSFASAFVQASTFSIPDFSDPLTALSLDAPLRVALAIGIALFGILGFVIAWVIYQVICIILGGKGPFAGLFTGFAFASVPSLIGIPFGLLGLVLGAAGDVLSGLVQVGLSIWVIVLYGVAIRENNGFSTGRAVAALLIPIAAFVALLVALIVLLVVVVLVAAGGTMGL